MLHSTFASIEDSENIAARALGREELHFEWDAVRAVMTRYDAGQQAELAGLLHNPDLVSRILHSGRRSLRARIVL